MPSINDLVEIAQELETKPVLVLRDRCAGVRNRNSTCRRCIEACPADAVTVANNRIRIDFDACVGCQACCTVCPTRALVPVDPLDADLAAQAVEGVRHARGAAVIACARAASWRVADPHAFAEVPCLCRVDESFLLSLAARGVGRLVLVDGVCDTCKHRATRPVTQRVTDQANQLLEVWGSDVRVQRQSEFPPECLLADSRALRAEERRGFFTRSRDTARQAASAAIDQQLHLSQKEKIPSLREMLQVTGDSGTLPQFNAVRQLSMMDSLDALGEPDPERGATPIETTLWGRVEIDEEHCTACGMCTMFCPTGALSRASDEDAAAVDCDLLLVYSNAECTQCRLCEDSCFKHHLVLGTQVVPDELSSFDPRVFLLHKPKRGKGGGMFGRFGGR